MSSLLEPYLKDVNNDLKIDQFNVKECQMRAPARKHFWVARMINTKIKLNELKKQKKELKQNVVRKVIDGAPTKLSASAVNNAAENSNEITNLNNQITDMEIVVEYLENVVKIMSNLHWEIKNIVDLMQMETQ